MVQIIRKAPLPTPEQVAARVRVAAERARSVTLREPRPPGFPLIFSGDMQLIEPAVAFLHEHGIQRGHTPDTVRTYSEILYDWFETLEQNNIPWTTADATDLVAYRNRMMTVSSPHTGRPYRVSTINHRIRGVMRFYEWAVLRSWLATSPMNEKSRNHSIVGHRMAASAREDNRSLFVLRQYESLPRPLMAMQAQELMAALPPPYDLMVRWQLCTGLRVSELFQIGLSDVSVPNADCTSHKTIDIIRKGRKSGYIYAPITLLDESATFVKIHRQAWVERARKRHPLLKDNSLFINSFGRPVSKNTYQRAVSRTAQVCGFKATTHVLRASFACFLLARLELLASQGAQVNPLLVVKVLMGHERIETTDRYLRAITVADLDLSQVLDTMFSGTE